MFDLHCHACGGFMSNLRTIDYRRPSSAAFVATPRQILCTCSAPIFYGAPSGYVTSPGVQIAHLTPSTTN